MTAPAHEHRAALERAHAHALAWLASLPTRRVRPSAAADELGAAFALDEAPLAPEAVVDELARIAEPGLMGSASGRFFGWVMGGTLPAALAADWLVSAWDQNAGLRVTSPANAALEQAAAAWLLDLLGLPAAAGVGFTTGGTMANFVGLAAGRGSVLARVGWDVNARGLNGAPAITVLAGAEVHASIELALRYLGLGAPQLIASDEQGRIRPDALAAALRNVNGPALVCLQAGNVHSGAFDPMRASIAAAHEHEAWVHVDGAFGLWAAASPRFAASVDGIELADSWATDAHKTLNTPYDCGIAIVADPVALRSAMGLRASYLLEDHTGRPDPFELVPEISRRGRGVPCWAALRSLGRSGVVALVERLAANARALAAGLAALPGVEVLNEVVFTQVSVSFGADERTRAVTQRLIDEGSVWMSGSRWRGREVLRISVSNWSTDAADVALAIEAVKRALG